MVRESLLSIYNNQTSILNEFTAKLMDTQNKVSDVKRLIDGLQSSATTRRKQDRNFLMVGNGKVGVITRDTSRHVEKARIDSLWR